MSDFVDEIRQYTKTPKPRIEAMVGALTRVREECLLGDIVECGVWEGGNIILARVMVPNRVCWLYDTFEAGNTAPGEHDRRRSGVRAENKEGLKGVSVGKVRSNLAKFDLLDDNFLRFVCGRVEDTLIQSDNLPDKIALLRLDTNWYASTAIELRVLYPRLVSGGVLIVDDYGHWMGAKKAVDEYFASNPQHMHEIDYSARLIIKE